MKEPLTIEYYREHIKEDYELVKYFFPNWTEEECEFYLWEYTSYPFSIQKTIDCLNRRFCDEKP